MADDTHADPLSATEGHSAPNQSAHSMDPASLSDGQVNSSDPPEETANWSDTNSQVSLDQAQSTTPARILKLKILSQFPAPHTTLDFPAIAASTQISELKAKIRDRVAPNPAPVDKQRLIHRGHVTRRDTDILEDVFGKQAVNSRDTHTLHLVVRDMPVTPSGPASVAGRPSSAPNNATPFAAPGAQPQSQLQPQVVPFVPPMNVHPTLTGQQVQFRAPSATVATATNGNGTNPASYAARTQQQSPLHNQTATAPPQAGQQPPGILQHPIPQLVTPHLNFPPNLMHMQQQNVMMQQMQQMQQQQQQHMALQAQLNRNMGQNAMNLPGAAQPNSTHPQNQAAQGQNGIPQQQTNGPAGPQSQSQAHQGSERTPSGSGYVTRNGLHLQPANNSHPRRFVPAQSGHHGVLMQQQFTATGPNGERTITTINNPMPGFPPMPQATMANPFQQFPPGFMPGTLNVHPQPPPFSPQAQPGSTQSNMAQSGGARPNQPTMAQRLGAMPEYPGIPPLGTTNAFICPEHALASMRLYQRELEALRTRLTNQRSRQDIPIAQLFEDFSNQLREIIESRNAAQGVINHTIGSRHFQNSGLTTANVNTLQQMMQTFTSTVQEFATEVEALRGYNVRVSSEAGQTRIHSYSDASANRRSSAAASTAQQTSTPPSSAEASRDKPASEQTAAQSGCAETATDTGAGGTSDAATARNARTTQHGVSTAQNVGSTRNNTAGPFTAYLIQSPDGPQAILYHPQGVFTSLTPGNNQAVANQPTNGTVVAPGNENIGAAIPANNQVLGQVHRTNEAIENLMVELNAVNTQVAQLRDAAAGVDGFVQSSNRNANNQQQNTNGQNGNNGQAGERGHAQAQEDAREVIRIVVPIFRHLWFMIRICGLIWFLTRGGGTRRLLLVLVSTLVYFAVQAGFLGGTLNNFRRHFEGLLGLPAEGEPQAHGEAQQPRNDGAEPNRPQDDTQGQQQQAGTTGGSEASQQRISSSPSQPEGRGMQQRTAAPPGSFRALLTSIERTVALFLASLYPGAAERHIAAQDAERERQARVAAEREVERSRERERARQGADESTNH